MIFEAIFLFIMGTAIGSFLNVVIDRLPREESLNGRSHCDYCKHVLSPLDLFPLFSYLFLGGKCRYCGKKLSPQYPAIEALTGAAFVLVFYALPALPYIELFFYLGIVSCLIAVFFTDLKEQIIPDELQIAFFVLTFLLRIVQGASVYDLAGGAVSGLIVTAPILVLYLITKGRGMGFGDVKLAFNIGFFLGWAKGLIVLYLGFIIGAAVGIILLAAGLKKMKSKIAFGPFLLLGVFIMIVWSDTILNLLKRIYGM